MKCHNFIQKHCLSCDLLDREYLSTTAYKEQILLNLFTEHAAKVKPTSLCDMTIKGSRNKAKLAVALVNKEICFGFYDNQKQFKQLENCPLQTSAINNILLPIKQQLTAHNILPYDVHVKSGELKYVIITYSESTNELLLRFVLRSTNSLHRLKKLAIELINTQTHIKVITANIQPKHQAILEGDDEIVLTDNDFITHHFDSYFLLQGPRSFFQTNSNMAMKLYRQFQYELSTLPIHTFLDLYCGVGAFSIFAKQHCHTVVGVELSDAAISYAKKARELNRCQGINFLAMDVDDYLKSQQTAAFDAIMVNPPRRGLNESIITNLIRLAPTYLFYSSCNVTTLHRDISKLDTQYRILSLQIFDMFPFTSHFETLAVLVKK